MAKASSAALAASAVAGFQTFMAAKAPPPKKVDDRPKRSEISRELPERGQHGRFIDRPTEHAGITGRVAQPPIDRIFARKSAAGRYLISARMHTAAQILRTDFEIGVLGARDVDGEMPPGIRSSGATATPSEAQIDALTNYKRAMRCLGPHVGAVVVAVCCYERDVSVAAGQMQQDRHEVMGVLKAGLKTLADHYRLTGSDDHTQDVDAAARHVR